MLGGLVRSMNAGLSCPDWPLCFGRVIPDYHPQVYFEFIHRVLAGSVSVLVVGLHLCIFRDAKVARSIKGVALFSLLVLLAQIVLGGLTVLELLKAGIVTLHLATGTAFFASMLWVYFSLRPESRHGKSVPLAFAVWSTIVPLVLFGQILLGGWVASNYAGLACQEFPRCYGQWIPTLSGAIGIHVIHRLGAYFTATIILLNFAIVWMMRDRPWLDARMVVWSRYLISLVLIQITLGVANVKFYLPPLITDLHLATAVGLFAIALRLKFLSRDVSLTTTTLHPVAPTAAHS